MFLSSHPGEFDGKNRTDLITTKQSKLKKYMLLKSNNSHHHHHNTKQNKNNTDVNAHFKLRRTNQYGARAMTPLPALSAVGPLAKQLA